MSAMNFNLRGLSPQVMSILKKQASEQHTSVNLLILSCIEKSTGYSHKIQKPSYHDLDYLAGTWDKGDVKMFEENTAHFEKIDDEMWS